MADTRMFFVGDYSAVPGSGSGSAAQWAGDQLNVENQHGWVRVKYVDEVDQPVVTPTKRWCSWTHGDEGLGRVLAA